MAKVRLHHFLPHSRANGPGRRAVLWVQGCSLQCPGCFNPETHAFTGGELVTVADLFQQIVNLQAKVEGVTISGGEPLQQLPSLLLLLQRLRQETSLSILIFSGFTWSEIQKMPQAKTLLDTIDVLIAGRYKAEQHVARNLLGSANQQIHLLTNRYTRQDIETVPSTEVIISTDGQVIISGVDPL